MHMGLLYWKMLHFLHSSRYRMMLHLWHIKFFHRLIETLISFSYNAAGSINISSILTGKCLAKVNPGNGNSCKQKKAWKFQNTVSEALEDITALYYDEERDEIYTGNRHGLVHVWSNWKLKLQLSPAPWWSSLVCVLTASTPMWWGATKMTPHTLGLRYLWDASFFEALHIYLCPPTNSSASPQYLL